MTWQISLDLHLLGQTLFGHPNWMSFSFRLGISLESLATLRKSTVCFSAFRVGGTGADDQAWGRWYKDLIPTDYYPALSSSKSSLKEGFPMSPVLILVPVSQMVYFLPRVIWAFCGHSGGTFDLTGHLGRASGKKKGWHFSSPQGNISSLLCRVL